MKGEACHLWGNIPLSQTAWAPERMHLGVCRQNSLECFMLWFPVLKEMAQPASVVEHELKIKAYPILKTMRVSRC